MRPLILATLLCAAVSTFAAAPDAKKPQELIGPPKTSIDPVTPPKINQTALDKLGWRVGC